MKYHMILRSWRIPRAHRCCRRPFSKHCWRAGALLGVYIAALAVPGGCASIYPGKDPLAETDADYITVREYEAQRHIYRKNRMEPANKRDAE